jgi:hypothetical protein
VANPEVEQAAREAMGELGADAVAFLIERAELADAISSSAAAWREIAEAASRMRPHVFWRVSAARMEPIDLPSVCARLARIYRAGEGRRCPIGRGIALRSQE